MERTNNCTQKVCALCASHTGGCSAGGGSNVSGAGACDVLMATDVRLRLHAHGRLIPQTVRRDGERSNSVGSKSLGASSSLSLPPRKRAGLAWTTPPPVRPGDEAPPPPPPAPDADDDDDADGARSGSSMSP